MTTKAQTKRDLADEAQRRADFTGEVHAIFSYGDRTYAIRPASELGAWVFDAQALAAADIVRVSVAAPAQPGRVASAEDILRAAVR